LGRKTGFLFSFPAFLALLMGGCSSLEMASTWTNQDLILNGDVKDWPGGVNPLYGEKISLGASNNGRFLFLALVVRDSAGGVYSNFSRVIMATGLTTWIDPRGGDRRTFGIRFLGMEEPGFEEPSRGPVGPGAGPPSLDLAADLLEIINEKGNVFKTTAQSLRPFGFEARTSYSDGIFIYLMKIPLRPAAQSLFPAALADSQAVGIDFESGPLRIHQPVAVPAGAVSAGSNGANDAGAGNNGVANDNPDQLSYWLCVDLAPNQRPSSK
jgi:hypothetical protein